MDLESVRLSEVKSFLELPLCDSELQDIVFLAAQICGTPTAMITLLDSERQHFVVTHGLEMEGSSVEHAFCNYTILQNEVLIVPDAIEDKRFAANPLVTGNPNIRFYAGATLKSNDGFNLGSLCTIDQKPGQLTKQQERSLMILSQQVTNRLESLKKDKIIEEQRKRERIQVELLAKSESLLKAMYSTGEDYYLLLNCELEIIAFNNTVGNFYRANFQEAIFEKNKSFLEFVSPEKTNEIKQICQKVLQGQVITDQKYLPALNLWLEISITPALNDTNEIIGLICRARNINNDKKQEALIQQQSDAIEKAAKDFAGFINKSCDLIWVYDRECKIVLFNDHFEAFVGKNVGLKVEKNKTMEDMGFPVELIEKFKSMPSLLSGGTYTEYQQYKVAGVVRHFEVSYTADPPGNSFEKIHCVAKDITEMKDQKDLLKDIAWIQSHGLRKHVANMLGIMDILNKKLAHEEEIPMLYDYLLKESKSLDVLIRDAANNLNEKINRAHLV